MVASSFDDDPAVKRATAASDQPDATSASPPEAFPGYGTDRLSLTSIEKFHCHDHDQDYPNLIHARIRFNQKIDREMASSAWNFVLDRQPLGRMKAVHLSSGGWQWETMDEAERDGQFEYREVDSPASLSVPQPASDPVFHATRARLSVVVAGTDFGTADVESQRRGTLAYVLFSVHHAVADGAGAIQAITEWLWAYRNLQLGHKPEAGLRPLDVQRLTRRNELGLTRWKYWRHWYKQPIAWFGAAKFMFRKTASLPSECVGEQAEPEGQEPDSNSIRRDGADGESRLVGRWVESEVVQRLYRQSSAWRVTANTFLMGCLWEALQEDRKRLLPDSELDGGCIRIILPMSLRTIADRRLPACNRTSLVQIDRRPPKPGQLEDFCQSLQREVQIIRRWQFDRLFLIAIRMISFSDRWLARSAGNPKSRGLVVFTDLGRPWKRLLSQVSRVQRASFEGRPGAVAGDLKDDEPLLPQEFDFAGPLRRGTPLNVSIARFSSRLRLSLHYDPRVIRDSRADQLLDDYLKRLEAATRNMGTAREQDGEEAL